MKLILGSASDCGAAGRCECHGEESLRGGLAEETPLPPGSVVLHAGEVSFLFLAGGFCRKLDHICAVFNLYRAMQREGL